MNEGYTTAGILFFDISGYSKLNEIELQFFHENVIKDIYNSIYSEKRENDSLYMNTWGDGIIILHKDAEKLIDIALNLRDYFNHNLYVRIDNDNILNNKELSARIAIHTGELLQAYDPFQGRNSYMGLEVVLPARIEPVTPPGSVWATDNLKNFVAKRNKRKGKTISYYNFFEIGNHPLAKAFGDEFIYEVIRPNEKPQPITDDKDFFKDTKANKKIKTIIKFDPIKNNFHLCSKNGDICRVQWNFFWLTAELINNSESMIETQKVLLALHDIFNLSTQVDECIDIPYYIPDMLKKVSQLRRSIDSFFTVLKTLSWAYRKKGTREEKFSKFIELKTKNMNLGEREIFIKALITMHKELKKVSKLIGKKLFDSLKNNSKLRDSLADFVKFYMKVTEHLSTTIAESKDGVVRVFSDELIKYDQAHLDSHLEKIIMKIAT